MGSVQSNPCPRHALGQEEQALVVAENAALGKERVRVLALERGGDADLVPVWGVEWCGVVCKRRSFGWWRGRYGGSGT